MDKKKKDFVETETKPDPLLVSEETKTLLRILSTLDRIEDFLWRSKGLKR